MSSSSFCPKFGYQNELYIGYKDPMNTVKGSKCETKNNFSENLVDAEPDGTSPLTGDNFLFTVAEIEVFEIL